MAGEIPADAPPSASPVRHRVLIVDDEVVACELIRRVLERDYDVATANTGEEGLAVLERSSPDVIITDQRMPGMSGVDFLIEARNRVPDSIRIVLTAYSDPDVMIQAINRGEVYRFVFKPWNPVDMRTEIRRALERQELQRENRRLLDDLSARNAELTRSIAELREARDRLLRAEKLALAGRFAAGFAHDIRNYLVAMANLEVFAERHADDATLVEMARFIGEAANDIKAMVGELSALARGEIPVYAKEAWSLASVAQEAVKIVGFSTAMQERSIEIACDDVPPIPMARERIRRLALNLLQNAAEATPPGRSVKVRVFADGPDVCLRVADVGCGIPPELIERIWEPFFTTKATGTGLGLDICRTIVLGHQGQIELTSEVGKGTTFTVRLPTR